MGLHTGSPHIGKEGYIGGDVHLGARIAAAAHGGQVVLSVQTRELVDGDITDLGEHRLKDIPDALAIFQLGSERFPPLKTLYRASLPIQPTPFLGRERELAEVVSLLAETRLLTLTGAGGSGKTRLAVQAADMAVGDYRDGVWWVRSRRSASRGSSSKRSRRCSERRLSCASTSPTRALARSRQFRAAARRRSRARGTAQLLSPTCVCLSRAGSSLHVRAELEYAVQPFVDEEAVGFFLARARAVRPQFEPSSAIAEICARLDNLPLALELAAARAKTLSADAILEQLAQRLPFLTGGYRDFRATADAPRHDRLELPAAGGRRAAALPPALGLRRRIDAGRSRAGRQSRSRGPRSRSWTRACSGSRRSAFGCWRRSASTRPSGWMIQPRASRCAAPTPRTTSVGRRSRRLIWRPNPGRVAQSIRRRVREYASRSGVVRQGTPRSCPQVGRSASAVLVGAIAP